MPLQPGETPELDLLDLRGLRLEEAHRRLGEHCAVQARRILAARLQRSGGWERVSFFRSTLEAKAASASLPGVLRRALQEYLACLEAWGAGAGLEEAAPRDCSFSPLERALFLQDEYSGCQTGALRGRGGEVYFWHAEEDTCHYTDSGGEEFDRFDRLRLGRFSLPEGGTFTSFIYPDLLPGPAFNWRSDGFIQAADTLYLNPGTERAAFGMLANAAAWAVLRLGAAMPPLDVVRALAPFADGYALCTAHPAGAEFVEFAGEHAHSRRLGNEPGDCLFQVNIFHDAFCPAARQHANLQQQGEGWQVRRQEANQKRISGVASAPDVWGALHAMLQLREMGEWDYVNRDVRACLLARLEPGSLHVEVCPGAAGVGKFISEDILISSLLQRV